ncbi:hypothetical protein PIGHUM_02236 [Pigmentiphaga humi]|uniref:DUF3460 domain-containing protein n=1 Tax=Pigmentiphaga humi TaxID=2478468 RepID=A0A3P4B1L0_9BURK|nr:DUF3460 family protein [Pigmentiphaga humi]VCU70169.1 hypothetical protein PIGHUM_02236 [Pigmentiphaga humi]
MAKSYESDITQFLQDLKQQRPNLEARQKQGRARLWDKNIDLEVVDGFKAAAVPQKPYVYQTDD